MTLKAIAAVILPSDTAPLVEVERYNLGVLFFLAWPQSRYQRRLNRISALRSRLRTYRFTWPSTWSSSA